MKLLVSLVGLLFLAFNVSAQVDQPKEIATFKKAGDLTVYFNVFHSTDIPANIANTYRLVRGRDRALINISVVKTKDGQTTLGLPAKVTGITKNLMQQQQTLNFIEVSEGDATYYLAPFVFNNEDLLHFSVQVALGENKPVEVNFNRTLYTE